MIMIEVTNFTHIHIASGILNIQYAGLDSKIRSKM